MSPFGIFTITLIVLYVVYYAVLITRELYSKKDGVKGEEEEFDISSLQDEDDVIGVQESENGFSLVSSKGGAKASEAVTRSFLTNPSVSGGIDVAGTADLSGEINVENRPATSPEVAGRPGNPINASMMANSLKPEETSDGGGTSQKKINDVQAEMEDIDPIGNLTMSKELFREILLDANKEGSLFIKKTRVSAT